MARLGSATTGVAETTFREELFRRGVLARTGVPGVYGRSAEFEDTVERVDRRAIAAGTGDGADVIRFPPVSSRAHFERSGYLASFPHLAGAIHAFAGAERAHRDLMQAVERGDDWSSAFQPTALMLTPAACYPVYPMLSGTLPAAGRSIDVASYCFRHEPSDDPARMQMFRMHEHVRAASPDIVRAWRDMWLDRAQAVTRALGLDARCQPAADPFFGRSGTLLASSQRDRGLKLEIVTPIASDTEPTAIASFNYHEDHFGAAFSIATADGGTAHTACVGFGLERIALALYRAHGFDRHAWPASVRQELGL